MYISLAQIKDHLKETGHKDSRLKNLVLEMIYESPKLLSVPEILSFLKDRGVHANKTSIYRIIELLLSQDIIYQLDLLDGKKRYGIKQGADYPHLICSACGKVFNLRSQEIINEIHEQIYDKYSFEVDNLRTQLFGNCKDCQNT